MAFLHLLTGLFSFYWCILHQHYLLDMKFLDDFIFLSALWLCHPTCILTCVAFFMKRQLIMKFLFFIWWVFFFWLLCVLAFSSVAVICLGMDLGVVGILDLNINIFYKTWENFDIQELYVSFFLSSPLLELSLHRCW